MIEVSVYKCTSDWNDNRRCLCQRFEYSASVIFPFDELRKALKVLFGKDCIIEIVLM